jgi:hypothetical protein
MYTGGLMAQTPRACNANAASIAQYAPEHNPMNNEFETSSGFSFRTTNMMSSSQLE